ncbi:MAG: hypothetical protein L0Y72_23615 [Gemmataceae bacterium]|nr:hypothetical protein [Gemmataceae bacterium]MCI0742033.1 hypothetical protein [Gemmataceae bacterium]
MRNTVTEARLLAVLKGASDLAVQVMEEHGDECECDLCYSLSGINYNLLHACLDVESMLERPLCWRVLVCEIPDFNLIESGANGPRE